MGKPLKYYFSPPPTKKKTNEYVNNFYETLSKEVDLVNYNKKAFSRSFDYLKFSLKSDVMILNWPEDILHLRFGVIQLFVSYFTFLFFKMKGGKIIWVCHNKDSHTKKYKPLRILTRKFYTRFADKIIVHSEDALQYLADVKNKVTFLNHPVYSQSVLHKEINEKSSIDVLIWGKIISYKGLNEFITNYKKYKCTFNVLITGEADKQYLKILQKNASGTNIMVEDNFISENQLETYFSTCKIILLPYLDSDTFSSGALIHSINSNKVIIGPHVGNFIDLEKIGACKTYSNNDQLFPLLKKLLSDDNYYNQVLESVRKGIGNYYENNSWHNFVQHLLEIIREPNKKQ